jgi:intradiol ring-cleaving dioxygenase-like protein
LRSLVVSYVEVAPRVSGGDNRAVMERRPPSLMPALSVATLLAVAMGSIAAMPPDSTVNLLPWTEPTSWMIDIAGPDEPGPRFEMSGRVFRDSVPQPGVHLYVYHADSMGWYARRGQKFNRIAGVLVTNEHGEYRFRSILPGTYEGAMHPHVHIEVWKGTHPVSTDWFKLILRQGGADWSYGRLHTALMARDPAGVYHCRRDIELSAMTACPASYDSFMVAERKKLEHATGR